MICGRCGATMSPGSDRCAVCHTRSVDAQDGATTGPGLQVSYPEPAETSAATSSGPTVAGNLHEPATTAPGLHAPFPGLSHATAGPTVAGPAIGGATLPPGQQFGPRYTIIRLLGSGGMASVYQAWDETLGTAVALKLIRVDATTPRAELRQLEDRFKRELKLARQVTHPNVVRIHDLGEVESTLYLTMEYVQGADLATLVQREPRLPLPRVLLLARQIAAGLAAAHKAGIVHRDLKPANVMVDAQDHALLMDFGIARSTTGATINTMPGSLIGTLDYMAPEQARGEPTDERTDVYAFGLILYELLAGGRPRYSAEGGLSGLIQRLEKGPPPLKSLQPDVPPALDRIVTKCLQPAAGRALRVGRGRALPTWRRSTSRAGRALPPRLFPAWQRLAALLVVGVAAHRRDVVACRAAAATRRRPSAPRAALPILIVDFENRAGEAVFDGALEQSLSIAMEGAPFITAFPRRDAAAMVRDLKLGHRARREDRAPRRWQRRHSGHPGGHDRALRQRLPRGCPHARAGQAGAGVASRGDGVRQGAGPRRGGARRGGRARSAWRHDAVERPAGGNVHRRNARGDARLHARAGSLDEPARRRGGGEVPRSAAPRPRVRPRLLGPRREPAAARQPGRSREELERGAAPHRPHDRAREAANRRRLLPRHRAELRQGDRHLRAAGRRNTRRIRPATTTSRSRTSACSTSPRRSNTGARRSRSIPRPTSTGRITRCMRCMPATSRPPPKPRSR